MGCDDWKDSDAIMNGEWCPVCERVDCACPSEPRNNLTVSAVSDIGDALLAAQDAGHDPGVYKRGFGWRVHLDVATGKWEDCASLDAAAEWLRTKLADASQEKPMKRSACFTCSERSSNGLTPCLRNPSHVGWELTGGGG